MLKKEKFAKEILDIVCEGYNFGVRNGKPVSCSSIKCVECEFNDTNCRENTKAWADSEYIEPSADQSKVPADTPPLENNIDDKTWLERHFEVLEKLLSK